MNLYQPPEDALPPQEVHFIELRAEPWPDNSRRVRIHLQITPFLERPNLEVVIAGPDGKNVSSVDIIETIEDQMTFTMHLRGEHVSGQFNVHAILHYSENGIVDKKSTPFEVNEETA